MTFSDTSRIIHGVEYLLDVATRMGVPLVVNISLGTNGGAHDGSSGVSRWLDAYLAAPGRAICIAAGNAGQEKAQTEGDLGWIMGRIHSQGRVPSRGLEVELEWTVVGDGIEDRSENELEIWYGSQDRFAVAVKPPGASDWISVGPREYVENYRLASGTTLSIYNELYHPTNGANYLAVYLSPNLDSNAFRGIEAGVWKVRLTGEEVRDGRFNAWIERDDPGELEPIGGRRFFRFPSFFTEASQHRLALHQLSRVRTSRHRRVEPRRCPAADQRQQQPGSDTGRQIQAGNRRARHRHRRCQRLRASRRAMGVDERHEHGQPVRLGRRGVDARGESDALQPRSAPAFCCGRRSRCPGASYDWGNDVGYGRINPMAAIEEAKRANERDEVRPRGHR